MRKARSEVDGAYEQEIEKEEGAGLHDDADAGADGADAFPEGPSEPGEGEADDDASGLQGNGEPELARERGGGVEVTEGDIGGGVPPPQKRCRAPNRALGGEVGGEGRPAPGELEHQ